MAADTDCTFSVTVQDAEGVEQAVTQYAEIDGTTTVADLATALQTWVGLIDAVTAAQPTRCKFTITPDLPSVKGSPVAGSSVSAGADINFLHAGANKRWGVYIPAIKAAAISSGKVLLTQTDVAALTDALLAAVAGGTYTNPTFQALSTLADAFLAVRKRRRQLRSKSYEV